MQQLKEAKDHLQEWGGCPLLVNPSTWSIYAAASQLAWEAVMTPSRASATGSPPAPTRSTPTPSTGDRPATKSLFVYERSINRWSQQLSAAHINAKEFHATIEAIEPFVLTDQHLDIYTDNTTV